MVKSNSLPDMLLRACLVITLLASVNSTHIKNSQHFGKEIRTSEDRGLVLNRDDVCVPERVPIFSVGFYPDSIIVEWTAPRTCVTGFIVFLDEDRTEVSYDNTTFWYRKVYDNLVPCTVYHVGVSVIGEDGTVGSPEDIRIRTSWPYWAGAVTDIAYEILNDSLAITWNPAKSDGNCVTSYDVLIWDSDFNIVANASIEDATYEITPYVPCAYYGISITPFIYSRPGNLTTSDITSPAKVNEPPTIVSVELGSWQIWLSARVVLLLEQFDTNACEILSTHVQCSSNDTSFGIVFPYEDSPSRPDPVMNVLFFSGNRTYTCHASVTNSEGVSELSESFIITVD